MLFETSFQYEQLSSVRSASCSLHHMKPNARREKNFYFYPAHCHPFFELQYYYQGEKAQADKKPLLKMFNSLQPHACEDFGYSYLLLVQISPGFLRNTLSTLDEGKTLLAGEQLCMQGFRAEPDSVLHEILMDIARIAPFSEEGQDPDVGIVNMAQAYTAEFELQLYGACLRLTAELMRLGLVEQTDTAFATSGELIRLVERIISDPGEKISLQEAASLLHIGYSDFSRYFKRAMGIGYVDFCNHARVLEAQNRLRLTDDSTGEIAEELGFGSASYFNRVFRQWTGCTPTAFREHLAFAKSD